MLPSVVVCRFVRLAAFAVAAGTAAAAAVEVVVVARHNMPVVDTGSNPPVEAIERYTVFARTG